MEGRTTGTAVAANSAGPEGIGLPSGGRTGVRLFLPYAATPFIPPVWYRARPWDPPITNDAAWL
jgi:hypothetical protein